MWGSSDNLSSHRRHSRPSLNGFEACSSSLPYDGRYVIRGGQCETLEGDWTPGRFVMLEFPSRERAREWWESPEYAPAKAIRQAISTTDMILVTNP